MNNNLKNLKDLSLEELKSLYGHNRGFSDKVAEEAYNNNMDIQEFKCREIFGERNSTIEYHDHYSSFYYTIIDHEHFLENIEGVDYLTEDNRRLYDEAKQLLEQWQGMTYYEQSEHEELWEQIEQRQTELVEGVVEQLRAYEQWSDEIKSQSWQWRYLVNHTKKQYIDLRWYFNLSHDRRSWGNDKYHCIHPLPLLSAVGNGMGGGDYHKENVNFDLTGSWAWDKISMEEVVPILGANEVLYIFPEEQEDCL